MIGEDDDDDEVEEERWGCIEVMRVKLSVVMVVWDDLEHQMERWPRWMEDEMNNTMND